MIKKLKGFLKASFDTSSIAVLDTSSIASKG